MKPLYVAICYILLNHVPFTAMRLAVSLYALHLHASPAVVGAIVALFSALPMLGSVHLGRLIDRKGVRSTLLVASAVLGFASLLAVLWPSVPVLFFVSALGGGAYITILIAGQQLVGRYGGAQARVANFSSLSTAFALSLAAVPMATGFVIEHIGFTVAFNMSGQPAVSVNAGYTSGGLPIGLQIIGHRFDDQGVLQLARAWEQLRPAQRPWPVHPA